MPIPFAPPRRPPPVRASKSATVRAAAAAPSKRQLSRWERERRQRRLLLVAGALLLALVAAILAGGLLLDNVVRANDTAAEVNGEKITAGQLVEEMRPAAHALDAQAGEAGRARGSAQALDQQKRQLPEQVLNQMVEQRLLQQEASRRGIAVTNEEIDQRMQQSVAQFEAAQRPTAAAAPTDRPAATAVPTLEPDAYQAGLKHAMDRTRLSEQQLRAQVAQSILREKLQEAIGSEQVPPTEEQIHARHILVPTEDAAKDVLRQLDEGADFGQLAQQLSTDPGSKDRGGDLGWFGRGVMTGPFESAAFDLQPGQRSGVVSSSDGFHIIEVLERANDRPVDPAQLTSRRQRAFTTWLDSQRTAAGVSLELTPSMRDWAVARIGVRP